MPTYKIKVSGRVLCLEVYWTDILCFIITEHRFNCDRPAFAAVGGDWEDDLYLGVLGQTHKIKRLRCIVIFIIHMSIGHVK